MDISSNNGICRCCASEGTFKDLSSTYQWMGEEEIYSEMLKECFDIRLSFPDECEPGGICEICVSQLRNASNFKKQVLHTEKQFKNRLHDKLFKDSIVKVEVPVVDDALDSDNDNNASEDFSVSELLVPVKEESIEDSKPKKRAARAVVSRSKKTKSEHGESSTKQQDQITLDSKVNFSAIISIPPWGEENKEPKAKKKRRIIEPDFIDPDQSGRDSPQFEDASFHDVDEKEIIPEPIVEKPKKSRKSFHNDDETDTFPETIIEKPRKKSKKSVMNFKVLESTIDKKTRLAELDLHKDNVKTIIRTTNITPVRYKNGDKYGCSYCRKEFEDPRELKCHSIEKHQYGKPSCIKIKQLSKFIAFLDTTTLMCKHCLKKLSNMEELIAHLKDVHEETIHPNIKTQIVPFKFEDGQIKCDTCGSVNGDFDALEAHVATHSKNYVCPFCELAFIAKDKMVEHKKNVHKV